MRLNSKVTWGLAWAGLALIVAVPSADFLTGRVANSAAVVTSTTDPVETGAVTTTRTANGIVITPAGARPADPAGALLKSGKKLPDYISDDSITPPTRVAAIDPAPAATPAAIAAAPTPFPSWARPRAVTLPTRTTTPAEPLVIVDEDGIGEAAPPAQPVIVDEPADEPVAVANSGPVPPANIPGGNDNWDDESLANYLDQEGLLDDGQSTATVTESNTAATGDTYDPDGFFLSDGPNGDRAAKRRARLQELFGEEYVDEGGSNTESFDLF